MLLEFAILLGKISKVNLTLSYTNPQPMKILIIGGGIFYLKQET